MKYKLLFILCLVGITTVVFAKKKEKTKKTTALTAYTGLDIPGTAFLRPVEDASLKVKFDYKQMNAPLPAFNIINYQGNNISDEIIKSGGNLLLVIFNPTCEHCENVTIGMINNIFLFKKSKVLLMAAPVQTSNLSYFNTNVKFSTYPSTITVAIDSANIIEKLFKYESLPQINIYRGSDMRLIRTFIGETPIDSLKPYIQ